jgi:hypothetical protein
MAGASFANQWCSDRATQARTQVNSNCELRLFKNNVTLDPSKVWADLTVADFDTYANVNLAGAWSAVAFVADGRYRSSSGPYTYNTPATTGNTLYGWVVYNTSTGKIEFGRNFGTPINFAVGAPAFSLTLLLDNVSISIL